MAHFFFFRLRANPADITEKQYLFGDLRLPQRNAGKPVEI